VGVESSLAHPASSKTTSVNVPPVSTPQRMADESRPEQASADEHCGVTVSHQCLGDVVLFVHVLAGIVLLGPSGALPFLVAVRGSPPSPAVCGGPTSWSDTVAIFSAATPHQRHAELNWARRYEAVESAERSLHVSLVRSCRPKKIATCRSMMSAHRNTRGDGGLPAHATEERQRAARPSSPIPASTCTKRTTSPEHGVRLSRRSARSRTPARAYSRPRMRCGVDTGGTFTDVVFDDGRVAKLLSARPPIRVARVAAALDARPALPRARDDGRHQTRCSNGRGCFGSR